MCAYLLIVVIYLFFVIFFSFVIISFMIWLWLVWVIQNIWSRAPTMAQPNIFSVCFLNITPSKYEVRIIVDYIHMELWVIHAFSCVVQIVSFRRFAIRMSSMFSWAITKYYIINMIVCFFRSNIPNRAVLLWTAFSLPLRYIQNSNLNYINRKKGT